MKLTSNTIFITGGTSGIGREMAEKFHQMGNQVIISGRRKALLDTVTSANPGMDSVVLDVTDVSSIKSAAKEVLSRYPALNVVINNAGIMPFDNPAAELDDDMATTLLDTNLLGTVRVSSAFVEHLKQQPDAVLINNSSILAFTLGDECTLLSNQSSDSFLYPVAAFFTARCRCECDRDFTALGRYRFDLQKR